MSCMLHFPSSCFQAYNNQLGSCPILMKDELIDVTCLKPRACSPDWNNSSIRLFTKIGHEPLSERKTKSILRNVSP